MSAGDRELHVYAIAGAGLPPRVRVRGHSLRTLPIGQAHVVVEAHRGRIEPTPESLQEQHAIVVNLAERAGSLLPARFGSVLTDAALHAIVLDHQPEILDALALVDGRRQMTVRVFGPPDSSVPEIDRASTGTAFLESRRARVHHVPAEVETIRLALGPRAVRERVDVGQAGGLRVTVFHLVDREKIHTYREQAASLQTLLESTQERVRVTVTGPWPAFAFAPELF
ncbi:MAG: GvpL/GvpF family gas vesicle protein [Burkholderiales bacterium]